MCCPKCKSINIGSPASSIKSCREINCKHLWRIDDIDLGMNRIKYIEEKLLINSNQIWKLQELINEINENNDIASEYLYHLKNEAKDYKGE